MAPLGKPRGPGSPWAERMDPGLPTPWQLQGPASKCGRPESKIRFSSNLAKLSHSPVHPSGPPEPVQPPGHLWTPLYQEMRVTAQPWGSEWDLRHLTAGFTLNSAGAGREGPGIRGWRAVCWGHLATGVKGLLAPAPLRGRDRFPRPSGSMERPLLGVLATLLLGKLRQPRS